MIFGNPFFAKSASGPDIGEEYEGGFYAGTIVSDYDGLTYRVIISDAGGDSVKEGTGTMMWRNSGTPVTSTHGTPPMTISDGRANHDAIIAAGVSDFPAVKWVEDVCNVGSGLNGYTDWYLPSRDELELLYRNFKPTTTNNNTGSRISTGFGGDGATHGTNNNSIPSGGGYTTSDPAQTAHTSFIDGNANALTTDYYWSSSENGSGKAWAAGLFNGFQDGDGITTLQRVRAVRRVAI